MFKNNNGRTIRHIIFQSLKANRLRNIFLMTSVILVSVLLTVVFGCGYSLFENLGIANQRIAGTVSNGLVQAGTDQDYEALKQSDFLSVVGRQIFAGELDSDSADQLIALTSYDELEWTHHILPTVSQVKGRLPENYNEVMLSHETVKALGLEDISVGDVVELSFSDVHGLHEKGDFTVTGLYEDYIDMKPFASHGNVMAANLYIQSQVEVRYVTGNIIVSESFASQHGSPASGTLTVSFANNRIDKDTAIEMISSTLEKNDGIIVWGLSGLTSGILTTPVLLIGLLVFFVLLCSYLLIYNITYIAVIKDMHTSGQLKTLGATSKQLKHIVLGQGICLTMISLPVGLLLGTVLSTHAIPFVLGTLLKGGLADKALSLNMVISPWLYLCTAVFTILTVLVSSLKPARLAGRVSPMEAVRFQDASWQSRKVKNSSGANKLHRLALRNVFRSPKRAFIVFFSLFMGLLIYLIVSTLTYGADFSIKYEREQYFNFTLNNFSLQISEPDQWSHSFDEALIEELKSIPGVTSLTFTTATPVTLPEEAAFSQLLDSRSEEYGSQERLAGLALGLEWEEIRHFSIETTLSDDELEALINSGQGVLLAPSPLPLEPADLIHYVGQSVTLAGDYTANYIIAGILVWTSAEPQNTRYEAFDHIDSLPVSTRLIMSHDALARLSDAPYINQVRIMSESDDDKAIQNQIDMILSGRTDIDIRSQYLMFETFGSSIDAIRGIGIAFSLFLLFMGLINFVNVMITNIHTRQKELAALESIGMTQSQIRKTLTYEGLYYAVFTLVLLGTLGMLISYGVTNMAQSVLYFFTFGFPTVSIILLTVILLITCAVTPNLAYTSLSKGTLTERLRKGTD